MTYNIERDLYLNVRHGETETVIEILNEQSETELPRQCKMALLVAAQEGHLEIVTEILKRVTCVEK